MRSIIIVTLFTCCLLGAAWAADEAQPTYAEMLGWEKGAKALIFHADDAGMSHDSNMGVIEAFEKGVLTSTSTMMPCPWVPEFAKYCAEHPDVDNGLHLTLTSEWENYRWGPLAGKYIVPGLADQQGCLWDNVELVVKHATAKEIEAEIRAQIDRAKTMGLPITHLDTHMGTVYATMEYFAAYVKVGKEMHIPVMIPGGHCTLAQQDYADLADQFPAIREVAKSVWDSGLPVIDDLYGATYGWRTFEEKKANTIELLRNLQPGVTQIIVHCTKPSETFEFISVSGDTRLADLEIMLDEDVKKTIEEEGIVLTSWRELSERRAKVGAATANPAGGNG
ncbi:MAG TPA: polysaccharide deacetylase family protein [Candidatus Hydrogenedentes bacterium]|nr:polysaccharide deacetylase family protein [Candidatus Hydrogenedentota bacterium]HQM50329.1 polysaccharide deacetylase family protein [Candidatus Hydrogenedentota bacterium]